MQHRYHVVCVHSPSVLVLYTVTRMFLDEVPFCKLKSVLSYTQTMQSAVILTSCCVVHHQIQTRNVGLIMSSFHWLYSKPLFMLLFSFQHNC
jgi:hypothetical protein